MKEPNRESIVKEFLGLPKMKSGAIDFSNSKKAPVLICFVRCKDEILLLKRSDQVSNYKSLWSTVAGFIDSKKNSQIRYTKN